MEVAIRRRRAARSQKSSIAVSMEVPSTNVTRPKLARFALLAIGAAVITIGLKTGAYFITGSVGLLSDALESVVNLVAAIAALIALLVASRDPDEDHAYGHGKVEYFSSGLEGTLILVAAGSIVAAAIPRLLHPADLSDVGWGLSISVVASVINGMVARRLSRAGKIHRSITLEADARHLLTDVWTSIGVVVGVGAVALTGWDRLDPLIALIVAGNIVWTGIGLLRRSMLGLMDTAVAPEDLARIRDILSRYEVTEDIQLHALRTRQAGARRFMSVHVVVPGHWSVARGHQLLEQIERDLRDAIPGLTVFTHLESLDDPASWDDVSLDREPSGTGAAS